MDDATRFRKGFLLALVIGVTLAFVFVIRDFLMTIFVAAILSGLAYPLYRRLLEQVGGRSALASVLTLLVGVLAVGVPVVLLLSVVTSEAVRITESVKPWVTQVITDASHLDEYLDGVPGIQRFTPYRDQLLVKAGEAAGGLGQAVIASISSTTRNTLALVLQFFMMLYAMFFFLMNGRSYLDSLVQYLPLRPAEQNRLLERFVSVTRATIKGTLVIGLVQGTLGGVILAILGVPGAVLWGVTMTVLSVLPVVGGALVWVPAALFLASQGAWVKSLVLVGFCSLVIGSVDNLLRPRLVGRDTEMSDLLILFSTLGGIAGFGAIGFIVGPIVAALFVTVWDIFGHSQDEELEARGSEST